MPRGQDSDPADPDGARDRVRYIRPFVILWGEGHMGKLRASLCMLVGLASPPWLAAASEKAPYPETGVQLGTGWQSTKLAKTNENCVVADRAEDKSEKRTQRFEEFSDTATFMTSLSMSAKAKASWIIGASGSASGSLLRTYNMDMNSLNISVDVRIAQGASYLVPKDEGPDGSSAIRLRSGLAQLAANNPMEFRRRCGDSFVSSIFLQSGIQGVYSFRTRTQKERDEIKGKMAGSYGLFSASASAKQIIDQMGKEGRLSIHYTQLGGAGTKIATTEGELRTLVGELGTVSDGAAPVEIGITYYSELPNFPQSYSANDPDIGQLADQHLRLENLIGAMNDMRQDRYAYGIYDNTALRRIELLQDSAIAQRNRLKQILQDCIGNDRDCAYPADLPRDDYEIRAQLPVRLSDLPDTEISLSQQDQVLQQIGSLAQLPSTPEREERMRFLKGQLAQLRRQREQVVLDTRFRIWIEAPSIARCNQDEAAQCLSSARRDELRQRYFNPGFGS